MNNFSVFTICAKNYLAQALTLRESTLTNNPNIDFFIYLADTSDNLSLKGLVKLDESWIPDWKNMAFKYDVIEFNTSIKPFCFNHLFNRGYEKVIYLDPDIYVTGSLDCIYNELNNKSIVLTPHYCDITENFNGAVPEDTFNCAGICNLGFCALKNDEIGKEIISWWMNRLHNQCYSDRALGLFVDQKWMDYIPSFFPNQTCISENHGLNVAIWNLHERELFIDQDNKYIIRRKKNGQNFPLIFFHFSGFDPFDNTTINRRHPQFNILTYPTFKPIIEEYRNCIYKNEYDIYSKMTYGFNYYSDGTIITPMQRRMFRCYLEKNNVQYSPFDVESPFYKLMLDKHFIRKHDTNHNGFIAYTTNDKNKGKSIENKLLKPSLKLFFKVVGPVKYSMLVRMFELMGRKEYHQFLIEDK